MRLRVPLMAMAGLAQRDIFREHVRRHREWWQCVAMDLAMVSVLSGSPLIRGGRSRGGIGRGVGGRILIR